MLQFGLLQWFRRGLGTDQPMDASKRCQTASGAVSRRPDYLRHIHNPVDHTL